MAKKRGRPTSTATKNRDQHVDPREAFHLPGKLRDAMLAYIEERRPSPTKSEVMRLALEKFLEDEGYWPPKP